MITGTAGVIPFDPKSNPNTLQFFARETAFSANWKDVD